LAERIEHQFSRRVKRHRKITSQRVSAEIQNHPRAILTQ
jgi:hypothetical protein